MTLCKHCKWPINLSAADSMDAEPVWVDEKGGTDCRERFYAGEHEPELREYTEEELARINTNARLVAQWGAGKRRRAEWREWWRAFWPRFVWVAAVSALASGAVSFVVMGLKCSA